MLSTFAPVTMGYAPTVAPAPSTVLRATAPAMAEVRRSRGGKAQGLGRRRQMREAASVVVVVVGVEDGWWIPATPVRRPTRVILLVRRPSTI